jgi:type 2 lantibiotic biosynthesis protein LanM
LAIAGQRDITWIGVAMNHKKWLLAPLKNELYAGLPGVIYFLAYLGAITKDQKYTELAIRGHETLAAQIAAKNEQIFSPGLFGGWAGIIYLYVHLAALWDRPELLEDAEQLAEKIPPLVAADETSDLTYGTAGAIAGLLALHAARPSEKILELAVNAGDVLLAHAQPLQGGLGWIIPAAGNQALAGFSHGAAGVAWAFSHLAQASGQRRFHDAALAALIFERSVYSPERKNWPDLRPPDGSAEPHEMCAWCHGAAGVGIGRIGLAGFDGDREVEAEIDIAVETTRRIGFGGNHSLCHGDLGNLELLLLAARRRNDGELRAEVRRRAANILDSIAEYGWLSGVPLAVETPGLMNGIAGIGHGLLRLADPERVPSLLMVEPPSWNR